MAHTRYRERAAGQAGICTRVTGRGAREPVAVGPRSSTHTRARARPVAGCLWWSLASTLCGGEEEEEVVGMHPLWQGKRCVRPRVNGHVCTATCTPPAGCRERCWSRACICVEARPCCRARMSGCLRCAAVRACVPCVFFVRRGVTLGGGLVAWKACASEGRRGPLACRPRR